MSTPPRDGGDRIALAHDPRLQLLLDVLETIGDVAKHHVLGNLRDVRDHRDDVVFGDVAATIDFGADRGGVEPADHLVGQVQVAHVARRQLERRLNRLIKHMHGVVALQARPQVVEDVPRLVFLDVFLVLAERGGGDHSDLAAREHRLEHVGGVRRRAERGSGADQRVGLVDEEDQVAAFLHLADHVLDPILEHPAQHRACDHRVHLTENLQYLLDLLVAAEDRRQRVLTREQIQVGREVLQKRRQFEPLLQPLVAQFPVAHARIRRDHSDPIGAEPSWPACPIRRTRFAVNSGVREPEYGRQLVGAC